jgi:hypothetical protein
MFIKSGKIYGDKWTIICLTLNFQVVLQNPRVLGLVLPPLHQWKFSYLGLCVFCCANVGYVGGQWCSWGVCHLAIFSFQCKFVIMFIIFLIELELVFEFYPILWFFGVWKRWVCFDVHLFICKTQVTFHVFNVTLKPNSLELMLMIVTLVSDPLPFVLWVVC